MARAGAAGAVVAGAAVAVLQVMQQTIGAFNPRPVVSALIVLAVFLGGLAASRLRTRRQLGEASAARTAELRQLVGTWPPPPIDSADPLQLGIFPARRDAEGDVAYVGRAIDPELRAALVAGATVLVYGPARAGKSRTALEAVRAALPGAGVLVPRGAQALTDLLALDPPVELGEGGTVVWLDGLERYAEALDAASLDALHALAPGLAVLATVRGDDWERLLGAGGADGELARAVAARARAFELPSALTLAECDEALRLHPGVDLSAGIGAGLAASGKDATPPPARVVTAADEPDPLPPVREDLQVTVPAAGSFAALAAFALVWLLVGFSTPPPQSIAEQVGAIKRDGSRGGRHARIAMAVDLHGSGSDSYLFMFEDKPGAAQAPRSDELRVYDQQGSRLVQRLRFEPTGPRAVYQYRSAQDVDLDGADEVVGGYGLPGEARQALVPFAIDWDDETQRYQLTSLDLGTPRLSRPDAGVPERQYRAIYATPTSFRDPRSGLAITARRVQDFAVTGKPYRMLAAYFLRPQLGADPARVELEPAKFDTAGGAPHLSSCAPGPPLVAQDIDVHVRSLQRVVEELWTTASSQGRPC